MNQRIHSAFQDLYQKLYDFYGPQYWWPADSLLEMIVGALLTQNTNWKNVETAIQKLKQKNLLDLDKLCGSKPEKIAPLIKSSGYYNIKAARLVQLLQTLRQQTNGSLSSLFNAPIHQVRAMLLSQAGVGQETADSILLYGGQMPIFVVDAYTRRVFKRHGLITGNETYEEIRLFTEKHLPADVQLYQELHALIVRVGAEQCKPKPDCQNCPLANWRSAHINLDEN